MSEQTPLLSRREMSALTCTALISPIFRQLPGAAVRQAGSAAWLSGAVALPLVLGVFWVTRGFFRRARPGEGLPELFCRALGEVAGRALLVVFALWLSAYLGFVLRAGADRFVGAIYLHTRPGSFIAVMAALTLTAGLGGLRALGRCAQVIQPILVFLFIVVFSLALPNIDPDNLLPVSRLDLLPLAKSALPVADTLAIAAFAAFLEGKAESENRLRRGELSILAQVLLVTLLCVSTLGNFGAELTVRLQHPFFVMLRDVKLAHFLERAEALLIAQWVFTDFVLAAGLLYAASLCSIRVLGRQDERTRRICALVFLGAGTLLAFFCAPTSFDLTLLSDRVFPLGNAALLFGALPLVFVIGRLRHKI